MSKMIDLTGQRFGRLTVLSRDISKKRTSWLCRCDCGNCVSAQSYHLRSGATQSCGCLHKERAKTANVEHGMTHSSLHNRWKAIRQRCYNPKDRRFKDYGARGIVMCSEWADFRVFVDWALKNGYKEELSLDRIDNEKGYSPKNCRWVKTVTNNRNRRNTAYIDGLPLKEFAHKYSLPYETVRYRYYRLKNQGKEITAESIIAYADQLPPSRRKLLEV